MQVGGAHADRREGEVAAPHAQDGGHILDRGHGIRGMHQLDEACEERHSRVQHCLPTLQ
jgi:hypothetical protein